MLKHNEDDSASDEAPKVGNKAGKTKVNRRKNRMDKKSCKCKKDKMLREVQDLRPLFGSYNSGELKYESEMEPSNKRKKMRGLSKAFEEKKRKKKKKKRKRKFIDGKVFCLHCNFCNMYSINAQHNPNS